MVARCIVSSSPHHLPILLLSLSLSRPSPTIQSYEFVRLRLGLGWRMCGLFSVSLSAAKGTLFSSALIPRSKLGSVISRGGLCAPENALRTIFCGASVGEWRDIVVFARIRRCASSFFTAAWDERNEERGGGGEGGWVRLNATPTVVQQRVQPACFLRVFHHRHHRFCANPFGLANSHVVSVYVRDADLDGS